MATDTEVEKLHAELARRLPAELRHLLEGRDAGSRLAHDLPKVFSPDAVAENIEIRRTWELAGTLFKISGRLHEALEIFRGLYFSLLEYQDANGLRVNKGMPLVWMSDCRYQLGHNTIGKRYLMLTLIEDSIELKGMVDSQRSGSYYRGVWFAGLGDELFRQYAAAAYMIFDNNPESGRFPEFVLQALGQDWLTEYPSRAEIGVYDINPYYVRYLIGLMDEESHGAKKKI